MDEQALIGLGSNLGDRRAILDDAIAALAAMPGVEVRAVSSYHETAPVGGPVDQGPFLNAAARLITGLDPLQLLARLQEIEHQHGRERLVRWGERTLDLDLLLFGDRIVETPELTIPHPHIALRRFVLTPLVEIAPTAVDPLTQLTTLGLLNNLNRRPKYLVILDAEGGGIFGSTPGQHLVFSAVVSALGAVGLSDGNGPLAGEDPPLREGLNPKKYRAALRQRRHELRKDRWRSSIWGDRWIVTDFYVDRLADDIVRSVPDSSRQELVSQIRHEVLQQVIRPTFVALIGSAANTPLKGGSDRPEIPSWFGRNVPHFRVKAAYREPDPFADYEATHPRSYDFPRASAAWVEWTKSLIVTACESS